MSHPTTASTTIDRIARAARAFIHSLDPARREVAAFAFDSDERENWHYVPRPRAGLKRGDMTQRQADAADALTAASLSAAGIRKARSIIAHETILGDLETSAGTIRFDRSPGLYHFSVFGDPGGPEPWGWRVEGHHLSLNTTVVDGRKISVTPSFFGANPARVPRGPHEGLRILREEEDAGRSLLESLDDEQMYRCTIYPAAPPDIITRASRRARIGPAVGLPASAMTDDQRERLVRLIEVYVKRNPEDAATEQMRRIHDAGLQSIRFGWAGSRYRGQAHYYRVHGPTCLIEYDNTQDRANHIHAVWRDMERDFGADLLMEHYREAH